MKFTARRVFAIVANKRVSTRLLISYYLMLYPLHFLFRTENEGQPALQSEVHIRFSLDSLTLRGIYETDCFKKI
nr:unnamed protein product [Callosobruchus analis]